MNFENEFFTLSLSDDWEHVYSDDPEQWLFQAARGALTVSFVPMRITEENQERVVDKLLESRFNAEARVRPQAQTSEPWGSAHPDGCLQVNYFGRDANNTYFFYTGFLTGMGVLSVTGELFDASDAEITAFFEEVLTHLRYGR